MAVLEDQEEERLELEDWPRSEKSDMILFDRRVLLSSDDWRPFRSLMTSFFLYFSLRLGIKEDEEDMRLEEEEEMKKKLAMKAKRKKI